MIRTSQKNKKRILVPASIKQTNPSDQFFHINPGSVSREGEKRTTSSLFTQVCYHQTLDLSIFLFQAKNILRFSTEPN
jgi:hypothetical protein